MGDLCVTIAKLTKLPRTADRTRSSSRVSARWATAPSRWSVSRSTRSPARDLGPESLLELDELIDRANRRVVGALLDAANPEQREWGLRMILVARCIERIGDHAVDIGEQTSFLVTGEFREFTDASRADLHRCVTRSSRCSAT